MSTLSLFSLVYFLILVPLLEPLLGQKRSLRSLVFGSFYAMFFSVISFFNTLFPYHYGYFDDFFCALPWMSYLTCRFLSMWFILPWFVLLYTRASFFSAPGEEKISGESEDPNYVAKFIIFIQVFIMWFIYGPMIKFSLFFTIVYFLLSFFFPDTFDFWNFQFSERFTYPEYDLVDFRIPEELRYPPGDGVFEVAALFSSEILYPFVFDYVLMSYYFHAFLPLPPIPTLCSGLFFSLYSSLDHISWSLYEFSTKNFDSHFLLFPFFSIGLVSIFSDQLGIFVDPLSASMGFLVCLIHFCTQIFSLSYMSDDPERIKFSLLMTLFAFCMLFMVYAPGFFQLFLGWEGIGLVSFLLIGFWSNRSQALRSAFKAISLNRIGDVSLLLSMSLAYTQFGTGSFDLILALACSIDSHSVQTMSTFTLMSFLILVASFAKSAQFLLTPWLPDAMEGPTPVSSLLHSATMVTAGIYLTLRFPLFSMLNSSLISNLYTLIGCFTALVSALAASGQMDLKKVVAHSTTSNLGLMFVALGSHQFHLAQIHLLVHGLYKALLFHSSGYAILNSSGDQDLRKAKPIMFSPLLFTLMPISLFFSLGAPGFGSFYSKEPIVILFYENFNFFQFLIHSTTLALLIYTSYYSLRPLGRYLFDWIKIPNYQTYNFYLILSPIILSFSALVLAIPFIVSFSPFSKFLPLNFHGVVPGCPSFPNFESSFLIYPVLCSIVGFFSLQNRLFRFDISFSDPLIRLGLHHVILRPISKLAVEFLEFSWTPEVGHRIWGDFAEIFSFSSKLALSERGSSPNLFLLGISFMFIFFALMPVFGSLTFLIFLILYHLS